MILRRSTLVVVPLLAAFWVIGIHTVDAQSCPTSSRPIKEGEIERAAKLGIILDPKSPCVDLRTAQWLDAGIEKDIEFFNQRICTGKTAGLPSGFNVNDTSPQNWNTIRENNGYVYFTAPNNSMNPGALRCFRQFFEAMEKQGYKPCVNSALRSLAHQRASCLAPNSVVCGRANKGTSRDTRTCSPDLNAYRNCPHVNGLAMDVGDNSGRVQEVLNKAKGFSGFTKVGATSADPWHIEAAGCADPNFKPSLDTKDTWTGAAASPSGGFANAIRSALGVQTQQPSQFQAIPSQSLSTGQTTLNAFNGNAPLPTPIVTNSIGTNIVASSSIADRLEELAFNQPTTSTQGATSVPLVISGASSASITSVNTQSMPHTNATYTGTPIQQTFTSSDLSWQPSSPSVSQNTFQQTLAILKTALVTLLEYLRPFGMQPTVTEFE